MSAVATPTKFGRVQSAPPMRMDRLVVHDGSKLTEIAHDIPIPVLDQEDLIEQGIDTSELVPGAQKVDALGSCTCNAGVAHLAERWVAAGKDLPSIALAWKSGLAVGLSATDAVHNESVAIQLYHLVTDQTGDPSSEWPPVDCGSSGYCVCTELERMGVASTYKSASGVTGALALLQMGTVMQGTPWFYAWMEPDSQGFIDGDGSMDALQAAIDSGVAGGHETLQRGIPQLAQLANGTVDLRNTVIKVRNSWTATFGLAGDFLVHASTLGWLAQYIDYKAVAIAA